jgi:hypothetical protein
LPPASPLPPGIQLPFPQFQQQNGVGGNGCSGDAGTVTRSLAGGVPGPTVFTDARNDNNFWGVGVRYDGAPLRIVGELAVPVGGGGGGGGGDASFSNCDISDVNFENDSSGGGGGGGGGVLVVKALGPIVIDGGWICADGGAGGGGEPTESSTRGGGGGGGAGGMVVLMSATRIDITARGATATRFRYGAPSGADKDDYLFSISADGGASISLPTSTPPIPRKYFTLDANGVIPSPAYQNNYDKVPRGGFGGMGVVQLMAPPGDNSDGTNTRLDDNINFRRNNVPATAAEKEALLYWRGYPDALGRGLNDAGVVIPAGDFEGDIRPSPVLLPSPVGAVTRLQSSWIDTGASKRRSLAQLPPVEPPRTVIGAESGPAYEFAGVFPTDAALPLRDGFARYAIVGTRAVTEHPLVVNATPIFVSSTNATYLGKPAYRVDLAQPALGAVVDRYTQYEAEVLNAADVQVGSFRILTHTDRELTLSPENGAFPSTAAKLRVRAKFFDVVTNGEKGLGPTYVGATAIAGENRRPVANVRIGFAFHQNPADPTAQRFPATGYTYDLADPVVQEQVRALGAAFVQWDVLFDSRFRADATDAPPALTPDSPRPELHFLRLPFRF